MSALFAGLGTLFAPAAAAATKVAGVTMAASAAGVAAGGLAGGGMGLFGSILSGVGQAMFARAEMREEERMQVEAERRREARYEGSGEAVRFWDREPGDDTSVSEGPDYQRVSAAEQTAAGRAASNGLEPPQGGENQTASRFQYNPQTGRIERH